LGKVILFVKKYTLSCRSISLSLLLVWVHTASLSCSNSLASAANHFKSLMVSMTFTSNWNHASCHLCYCSFAQSCDHFTLEIWCWPEWQHLKSNVNKETKTKNKSNLIEADGHKGLQCECILSYGY